MSTLQKEGFEPFTMVPNSIISDRSLGLKALGLMLYLISKPNGWNFSIDRIANGLGEGDRTIRYAIQKLEKIGYLERKRQKTGRVQYVLHSKPIKATLAKRHSGETQGLSKTDSYSKKEGTVAKATTRKKSKNFIQLKKEKIPMEELTYIPEDSHTSRSQSKYGHRTMAILVRTFAESAGIEIKGTFDASPWMTPLSAVYRHFNKDVDATIAFIRRASEFFEEKGLAYTPHTLHKNLLFIDKWLREDGDKKFSHLENNPLYE